jgi:hypothetical protein
MTNQSDRGNLSLGASGKLPREVPGPNTLPNSLSKKAVRKNTGIGQFGNSPTVLAARGTRQGSSPNRFYLKCDSLFLMYSGSDELYLQCDFCNLVLVAF